MSKTLDVMTQNDWAYGGSTGYARYEFSDDFVLPGGQQYEGGSKGYLEVSTTILGSVVTIPAYPNFPETEAAILNNGVTVTCHLLDSDRKKRTTLFEDCRIYTSLPSVVSLDQLVLANGASRILRDTDVWTKEQVIDYVETRPPAAKMTSLVFGNGRLTVPAVSAIDPVVVGNNDPRVIDISSYASLAAAVSAIGATPTTFNVTSNIAVTADLTIPSTMSLRILKGGGFTVTTGEVLTLYGYVEADPGQKIFYNALAGQGSVMLFNPGQVAHPDWWAANAIPGTTPMSPALQAAMDSGATVVELMGTNYRNDTTVTAAGSNQTLRGKSGALVFTVRTPKTISAATNAASVVFTSANHGLTTGDVINVSGATGNWYLTTGVWTVTVLTANTFSIPFDSTSAGVLTGSPVFVGQSYCFKVTGDDSQTGLIIRDLKFTGSGNWGGLYSSILHVNEQWDSYPTADEDNYTTTRQNFVVENCVFVSPQWEAIAYTNTSVSISNVQITDGANLGNNGNITVRAAENCHFNNLIFIRCDKKNLNTNLLTDFTVDNVIVRDGTGGTDGTGIYIGHFCRNYAVSNFVCDGDTDFDLFMKISYAATNGVVNNCTLSGNGYVLLQGCQGLVITGLKIETTLPVAIFTLYHDGIAPLLNPVNITIDGFNVISTEDGSEQPKVIDLSYGNGVRLTNGRVNGNVFANPAGNVEIRGVRGYYSTAWGTPQAALSLQDFRIGLPLTNATNATPIVITSPGHGLVNNSVVDIDSVVGNTAANGSWVVTRINADTFSLNTSVGNGAYVSGGRVLVARDNCVISGNHFETAEDFNTIYLHGASKAAFIHFTNNVFSANASAGSYPVLVDFCASGRFVYSRSNMSFGARLAAADALINYTNASLVRVQGVPQQIAFATGNFVIYSDVVFLADTGTIIPATLAAPKPGDTITIINSSASGTIAHTVTVPVGVTWDGTNRIATFNAPGESLTAVAVSATRWQVLSTTGSVTFS